VKKKAAAGELVLLSQDEARFSLIPTLRITLGVKGHRPLVGNLDCHASLYLFGALNLVTGQLTTRLVERPASAKKRSAAKQRYLQDGFARHLRDIARAYPAAQYARVVVVIDKASWHKGAAITAILAEYPHLELYPLPSYSPQLQVIERFWKVLRRRATHNRLFPTMAQLKHALRSNLSYYHTLKHRVLTVIQSKRNRTKVSTA
jgi:transposase